MQSISGFSCVSILRGHDLYSILRYCKDISQLSSVDEERLLGSLEST